MSSQKHTCMCVTRGLFCLRLLNYVQCKMRMQKVKQSIHDNSGKTWHAIRNFCMYGKVINQWTDQP